MRTTTLLGALLILSGCGPEMDERINGVWEGTTRVDPADGDDEAFAYYTKINARVDGDSVSVTGLCPDGSGGMTLEGERYMASWRGSMTCSVRTINCAMANIRHTGATLQLSQVSRSVKIESEGILSGCGEEVAVVATFHGGVPR